MLTNLERFNLAFGALDWERRDKFINMLAMMYEDARASTAPDIATMAETWWREQQEDHAKCDPVTCAPPATPYPTDG